MIAVHSEKDVEKLFYVLRAMVKWFRSHKYWHNITFIDKYSIIVNCRQTVSPLTFYFEGALPFSELSK